jgi:tRNA A-37 threonylcarbamoyl transferase component Bud32
MTDDLPTGPAESEPPDETQSQTELPTVPRGADPKQRIGPYLLLQRLGEGGMGEVWLAQQERHVRRRVALKLIKAGMDTAVVAARFEAERQALAIMNHPSIARVYDAGSTELGRPYFAMEHVDGEPITDYCDRHRLSTRDRLEFFIRVCEGVQHAHQKGVIHRDLKPSNVLVRIQDDKPVPKVIDFGVAKAIDQRLTEKTLYTELGMVIGTPEYMSPEQAEMTGLDIDTRTDVYSLGVSVAPDSAALTCAGLLEDGSTAVCGTEGGALLLCDLSSQIFRRRLAAHSTRVGQIVSSPDGSRIVSGATDGSVIFWELKTWRELLLLELETGLFGLTFSPDGTCLAFGRTEIRVLDSRPEDERKREREAHRDARRAADAWLDDLKGEARPLPEILKRIEESTVDLGRFLDETDHAEEAEALLRDALARVRCLQGDGHVDMVSALRPFAVVLNARGRFAEAEPLLLDGYAALLPPGRWDARRRAGLERIVELYEVWGKPDEAAGWRARREDRNVLATRGGT